MEQALIDFVNNTNPLPPVIQKKFNPRDSIKGCMGNDPMRPYRLPSSKLIYEDTADIINNKPYDAIFPQSYTPISKYFTDNNISPYFSPMEGEDFAKGKLTIAGMIELCNNNQPFIIVRDQDLEEIHTYATSYLDQLLNLDKKDKLKYQRKRFEYFLNELDKCRSRMFNRRGIIHKGPLALKNILSKLIVR